MAIVLLGFPWSGGQAANDGSLRIIVFGAHPDDCELKAGGVAALWAAQGHKVKFVSTTTGDIGEYGRQPSAEELKQLFPFFGP